MEMSMTNSLESLIDNNILFEYVDEFGDPAIDVALDFEENLASTIGDIKVSNLF